MAVNYILPLTYFLNDVQGHNCHIVPGVVPVDASICPPETRDAVYKAVDVLKRCMADYNSEKIALDSSGKKILFPQNLEMERNLNVIAEVFPEFLTTVNKPDTHKSTLSTHLLTSFKNLVEDPDYAKLSDEDKRMADFAVLFHDIAKKAACVDPAHPENSAVMAGQMMKRFGWSDKDVNRISHLIRNHHWVANLETCQKSIFDVANDFNNLSDFSIGIVMTKSDIKAGKAFIDNFNKKYLGSGIISKIQNILEQNTGNVYYYPYQALYR
jgi:hypothetical protein